jgi:nucleoside-diphosphate-sugar epimerase
MRVFVTGATGYIGGSLAGKLVGNGASVSGLTRTEFGAEKLRGLGIEPVLGALADGDTLAQAASRADAVINAANSDDVMSVETMLAALRGSGKTFIQTSGSSVIADRALGEPGDKIFHEDSVYEPLPERAMRVAIDRMVLAAAHAGVRSVVIRPTLIYGVGRGLHRDSVQVPKLIAIAKKLGAPRHVGRGLNIWSHVHIEDVVDLYLAALERALPGSLFYAENGECSMHHLAAAIGRVQSVPPQAWPVKEAFAELGAAAFTTYGSNSRVRADKARAMLGWKPNGKSLFEEIERGCYRDAIRP